MCDTEMLGRMILGSVRGAPHFPDFRDVLEGLIVDYVTTSDGEIEVLRRFVIEEVLASSRDPYAILLAVLRANFKMGGAIGTLREMLRGAQRTLLSAGNYDGRKFARVIAQHCRSRENFDVAAVEALCEDIDRGLVQYVQGLSRKALEGALALYPWTQTEAEGITIFQVSDIHYGRFGVGSGGSPAVEEFFTTLLRASNKMQSRVG